MTTLRRRKVEKEEKEEEQQQPRPQEQQKELPWTYYALRVGLVTWVLCLVATSALQLNAQIPHTYFFGGINGILHSEQYVSRQAVALALSATRLMQFLALCGLMVFRRRSCGRYPAPSVFWAVLLAVLVLFDVIALLLNSALLHDCNSAAPGNQGNPCNAPNWCCAPEVHSNSANGCRISTPCIPGYAVTSVAQLSARADFLWVFALNVLFVACGIGFVVMAFMQVAEQMQLLRAPKLDETKLDAAEMEMLLMKTK